MNFKGLLAIMILGGGGTVLALAASGPQPVATAPKSEITPTVVAVARQPAAAETIAVPAPIVVKVAAATPASSPASSLAPSKDTIIWSEPRPASNPQTAPQPSADEPALTQRQLDALLAPIALYPDQLLSQILMASTYPLEVIEVARWLARPENDGLTGDRLAAALEEQDWDPSVKALVAFPHILKMMDADLDWMGKLGEAFQTAEAAVMDSVQHLRREAKAADKLNSDTRQRVIVEDSQIIIEPANPEVVYVPFYDPQSAYGLWPYPDYPPVYVPPPLGYTYSPGVYYSFGSVSPFWGWSRWDWGNRRIHIVDVPRYTHYNRGRGPVDNDVWRHDPRHGDRTHARVTDRPNRPDNRPDNRFDNNPPPSAPPGVPEARRPRGPVLPGTNNAPTEAAAQPYNMRRRGALPPPGMLPDVTPPLPATHVIPAPASPIGEAPAAVDTNRFGQNNRRGPVVPQPDNTQDNRRDDNDRRGNRQFRGNNFGERAAIPPGSDVPNAAPPPPRGSRMPQQPTQVFVPPAPAQSPAIAPAPQPQPQQDEPRGANFRQRGYVPPPAPDSSGDNGQPCQRLRGGACKQ